MAETRIGYVRISNPDQNLDPDPDANRGGMAVERAKGKLRGKRPKLSIKQQKELLRMYDTGERSILDLSELFALSRPTVYCALARVPEAKRTHER
ncbi:Mobile element protein [Salinisphaera sp. LB1]|nr:Mobile element protein [Salinisphaera sp. LB1]